jgi:hypothetical protein
MNITTSKVEYSSYPNNEWIVDFESGENGNKADSIQTIRQAVMFALNTERYKYPIMGANYGVTFEDLIGSDYSYVRSEIARRIRDALSIDDRIMSIDNFQFTTGNNSDMLVTFDVKTILGDIPYSMTVNG